MPSVHLLDRAERLLPGQARQMKRIPRTWRDRYAAQDADDRATYRQSQALRDQHGDREVARTPQEAHEKEPAR